MARDGSRWDQGGTRRTAAQAHSSYPGAQALCSPACIAGSIDSGPANRFQCDGGRPECSTCRERGTACEYDTHAAETHAQALKRKFNELQSQQSVYESIYALLQSRPQYEADEILQRIRTGADAEAILRHVSCGDLLVQLALVPETRYRYEFPYISAMPDFLLHPNNPYLDSDMYSWVSRALPTPGTQHRPFQPHTSRCEQPRLGQLPPIEGSLGPGHGLEPPDGPYSQPYHAARVIDPLLDAVKPSKWTSVSGDDALMRQLLHGYLQFEHDWFPYFHKEYVLTDMANEKPRFCSELLVNAVLALGSVSFPSPNGIILLFC